MILISHRGNTNGKILNRENSPDYIQEALDEGYECEIDVWFIDGKFKLGHDGPEYDTDLEFLSKAGLWCHAKNVEALSELISYPHINCFWHQTDDVILTSKKYLWTFPGKQLTNKSIAVLPENTNWDMSTEPYLGICSDFIERYKTYE